MPSKSSKNKTEPKAQKKPEEQDRIIVVPGASTYSAFNYYANNDEERKAASARFRASVISTTARKIKIK